MKHLRQYIKLICEQEQLAIPLPETLKAAEKEKLVAAFMDDPSHGLHLAEMIESEMAEDFHEIKENVLYLIEMVEDKSDLQYWGGYNYQDQSTINKIGTHIIDDLIHIGIDDQNEIFQLVKAVYMGCTNQAMGTYCIENTEALKDWVGVS